MKNIFKIIYLSILLLPFLSCNDAIDIEQPGRLDAENAFNDVSDLRAGLLGAYDFFDTTGEIGFTASFTDEVFRGISSGGQNSDLQNFNTNISNAFIERIWSSYYGAIGMANRLIAASSLIDRNEDPEEFDNILGQAYCIRAFAHFQILTYFSTDYEDDSALAGILLDAPTTDIFASVPRSTNGEFYNLIESDLTTAANLINSYEGPKFMGQDFITALRARIAAYRGQYTTADALAASLLNDYPIANQSQYFSMYDDADFTEVIFSFERTINDNYDTQGETGGGWAGALFSFSQATADGGIYMELSRSTFNLLNGTNDIRFGRNVNLAESLIDPNYETNDNFINDDVLVIFKYPGSDGQPLLNDLKVFRSSEMLLIRAEAAADANQLVQAANFIKQLRDARYGSSQPAPSFTNQTEAFGAILDERRLEFLLEGHRWVDLKRLGARGNRTIDRDAKECSFLEGCTLSNNDYRFTLPIPLSEVTANSAVQQNPGY